MYLPLEAHLGNEHEPLPYHEGAEDDHGEVEALEEELALVRPELLELEDLLVYHLPEHCFLCLFEAKNVCERGQGGSNATAAERRQEQQPNGRGGWLGRRFKGLEVMPLFHICSICHTFLIKNL